MGVHGAALATILSQTLSAAFVLRFLKTKAELKIRFLPWKELTAGWNYIKEIVSLGTAGFIPAGYKQPGVYLLQFRIVGDRR